MAGETITYTLYVSRIVLSSSSSSCCTPATNAYTDLASLAAA